jgi:hypothetical protein
MSPHTYIPTALSSMTGGLEDHPSGGLLLGSEPKKDALDLGFRGQSSSTQQVAPRFSNPPVKRARRGELVVFSILALLAFATTSIAGHGILKEEQTNLRKMPKATLSPTSSSRQWPYLRGSRVSYGTRLPTVRYGDWASSSLLLVISHAP